MHSPQPTNLAFILRNQIAQNVSDDRLIGWSQSSAGDPICREPSARGFHTGFILRDSIHPMGAAGERPEFEIKPLLKAPLLIFPRGYHVKSFPKGDTSARQWGFEIRVFPLHGELPRAIEPNLPVCQFYRWQLGPNEWSLPTINSLDLIVVTALSVGIIRGKFRTRHRY